MALTVYATATDLDNWLDDAPPDNSASLLRSATFLVALACERNPFSDVPSGADAEVLSAATCTQAASWIAAGIDPATLAIGAPLVKKSSILGADVEVDTATLLKARQAAIADLCPEARAILTGANLIFEPVPLGASQFDRLPQWGQGRGTWPWPEPMSGEFEWPFL